MLVVFTRRDDGGSLATFTRPDGVALRLRSYDRTGEVPHDAVHLVGERELGWHEGLWGSLAAGVVFDSVEVLEGRQRHDWRRRSDDLRRRHAAGLAMAEVLVGALQQDLDADGPQVLRSLDAAWGITRPGPSPFTVDAAAAAAEALRGLRRGWAALPVGGALPLEWPAVRPGRAAAGRGRR